MSRNAVRRSFGDRVRARRKGLGRTQAGLAELADAHCNHISVIEQARIRASVFVVVKLAAALGVEPGGLLRPYAAGGYDEE